MSVNSSSSSNSLYICSNVRVTMYIYDTIAASKALLLLPLSTFVLYLGHQRWRQHRSSKPATHSDIFTYHVAVMELIWALGNFSYFGGKYTDNLVPVITGMFVSSIPIYGETLFHALTCVERYLAVVHPITYMRLRNARGVKIRNISIGCVWLLSFGNAFFPLLTFPQSTYTPFLCLLAFCIIIISFCSLSVLCVLVRPGPGEGGEEKEHVDQTKQRAFHTITAISVTVWLWFFGLLVAIAVNVSPLDESVYCVVITSVSWLNLPSNLVSPLLYLHRAGKLSFCC